MIRWWLRWWRRMTWPDRAAHVVIGCGLVWLLAVAAGWQPPRRWASTAAVGVMLLMLAWAVYNLVEVRRILADLRRREVETAAVLERDPPDD